MSKDEFDSKILKNIGGFLSINSFFSTSANKQVASMFISNSASNDSDIESVLFEITIEIQKCRQPVADIKHMSYMEEEDEILFSMAAVFRIESVQKSSSENIWIVRLIMNGEEDEELNAVANSIKKELGLDQSDSMNTFGGLLTKMGEYQNAERYYLMLIEDTQFGNSSSKVRYYSNLSLTYSDQDNYDAAISCAEKALQLQALQPYELAGIYTNLGLFHLQKHSTVQAFEYLHKAENLYRFLHLPNDPNLGQTYMHMAEAYAMENNFSQAVEHFLKTIDIFRNSLPANHPYFGTVYYYIGDMYMKQTDYNSAVFYFLKTLEIQQRSLLANHLSLALTYSQLGNAYSELPNEMEAYNSFQKALETIRSLPNHPIVSYVMYSVGSYYKRKNKVSEALNFYQKALDVQMKLNPPYYTLIMQIYKHLVQLYLKQRDWIKVIEYCERAISLAVTYNYKNVHVFYSTIAFAYISINMHEMGLRYIDLALDIGRGTLPADHCLLQQLKEQRDNLYTMVAVAVIRNNSKTAKK
jgi:tetratricopeptide (TPR) repeat protein